MMTTLHGLVTISELFVGFNLINTGVLNCVIMCQNARKMHHSEAKKIQKFSGRGHSPLPRPLPIGDGDTSSKPHHLGACGVSITRAFGARPCPQTKILDPPVLLLLLTTTTTTTTTVSLGQARYSDGPSRSEKEPCWSTSRSQSTQRRLAGSIADCRVRSSTWWRDEAIHVAVALQLGLDLCVPHVCRCGSQVDAWVIHALL